MKRLVVFCFCLLFGVLSALSILNFDGEAVGAMEGKMSRMMIVKPQGMDNTYFLTAIDNALKDKNADIMMRIVSLEDGKPINRYYKTNHTSDFLDIKTDCGIVITGNECIATVEQEGYTTHRLGLPALSQDIAIFDWYELENSDISNGIFYAKEIDTATVSGAISELGMDVVLDRSAFVHAGYSFWLFGFVPAFLFVISVMFYTFSIAKKNVLKRIDGYSGRNILKNEFCELGVPIAASFGLLLLVTLILSAVLFKNALMLFLLFYLKYFAIGICTLITGLAAAAIIISTQRKATHSKGQIPKNGIYNIATLSKCVILLFSAVFISIAVRNVSVTLHTYHTAKNLSEKVSGYMTVPIYINNASLDKEAENGYLQFYLNSVSAYDGILVYSGNYDYDVTSGKTINEEFAHENRDYIVVNRNYLHFNPILTSDGRVIDESMLSDDVINVLFPEDKSERIDTYRENVRLVYSSDPNILLYDGQASEIYAYNPNISTGNGLIDQPIIVVVENHHLDGLYITSYISKGAYFIKTQTDSPYTELYPLLKASGIEAYTLELRSVADNYEKVIARQLTMLRIFGTQSVFLLIGLFALIIFTASLYCENYKRKIAACMIEGYSLTNCIRGHLILTIFVYGVSILALWAIEKMNVIGITAESLILPIALLLDIAVTYGLCRRYSTANLYSIMKGAE